MRGRRSLAVLAMAAPLAVIGLALAPNALASDAFVSPTPADGEVRGSNSFTVTASIPARSQGTTLTVTGRDAQGGSVCTVSTSTQGGALSGSQNPSIAFPNSKCDSRNRRWTATLSGGASGTRSFSTNAAPSSPSSFSAAGSGARDVTFQWSIGGEADLVGYALYDGSGNAIDSSISLDHCNGSTCTYALYYPSDNPGTHSYELAARRASAGCSTCGNDVESSRAAASATLTEPPPPPPPPPSPTPSPTPPGGTGGGTTAGGSTTGGGSGGGSTTGGSSTGGTRAGGTTGGTTSGGSTGTSVHPAPKPTLPSLSENLVAARRAFALSFNAFSPSLGIPKLPPLPAAFAPTIGPSQPQPLGTYQPTLPYKPQTTVVDKTSTIQQLTGVGGPEINTFNLARSIAIALLLILVAAHLRRVIGARHEG